MMRSLLLWGGVLIVALLLTGFASADIPVHCLRNQVLGSWTFYLGENVYSNLEAYGKCVNWSTSKTVSKLRLRILDPDVVFDIDNNVSGFWSFVYDEGIEIVLNNKKYFAYFKYEVDKNGNVTSYCGQTTPGWYHDSPQYSGDTPRSWGCYIALKDPSSPSSEQQQQLINHYPLHSDEFLATQHLRQNAKYRPETEMTRIINSAKMTWHASDYNNLFSAMTVEDLHRHGGKTIPPIKRRDMHKFKVSMKSQNPVHQRRMNAMATDPLPLNWDWRSINGVDYVSPVRNQAHCGSCYSFGTLGMLEARINIISKFQTPMILSPQSIVSCSFYSQGCNGGFGYLVGKWGEDFGILSETCFPYVSGNGTTPPCSDACQITPANVHTSMIKATDYYYVGGFFGACNEQTMMQELYSRGPVAVSFLVTPEFRLYKGGIFRHNAALDEQLRRASVNPWAWEETNHLVLLVGWGFDATSNTKYWIVKNSWGESWGENGFFRIVRGVDELAIESMAESAMPVLL